jgi:hypothetical protein
MTLTVDPIAPAQTAIYSSSAYPGLLSDLEQARIVERIVGLADEQITLALSAAEVANYGVRTARIGAAFGLALRRVDLPMLNRVVGLGLGSERDQLERAIDEIFSLYGGAPVTFLVQVSPTVLTPELDRLLESRGLQRMDNWACLIRGIETPPEIPTSLRIERVGLEYAEAAAQVACAGFELPAEYGLFLQRLVGRPGWQHYLAFDGDQPVATGALYVEGGVGYLTFGATLATHRGRGAQGAIIVRRIREAAALGCRWLVSETAEDLPERPFPSYRNMLRAGFRLAYLRPNYVHLPRR